MSVSSIRYLMLFSLLLLLTISVTFADDEPVIYEDLLLPYIHGHGNGRGHRHVRECQPAKYDNVTYEVQPSHHSDEITDIQAADVRPFAVSVGDSWNQRTVYGHQVIVNNPAQTVLVIEPGQDGGCQLHERQTVAQTAEKAKCIVAVNAGFFNVTDGACLGNVVSRGRLAMDAKGIQNANFGIKKDGSLFFGYLSENEDLARDFKELVAGVVWLVRNGENYINVSKITECPDSQSTSTLEGFISVLSGRTVVGHDSAGRLVIVQIDGKTWQRGMSMYELAELLISFGLVNAINLDGGGSTTMVVNGSVVNYPSDQIKINNHTFGVARKVSTILCIRDFPCNSTECSGHGTCVHGRCQCIDKWSGTNCDIIKCGSLNCSGHGVCHEDGCNCFAGWHGENCTEVCSEGHYGPNCISECHCWTLTQKCSPIDGHCHCPPGLYGFNCELQCQLGTYGENCSGLCNCADNCFCDPVTGNCQQARNTTFWQIGQCFGEYKVVERVSTVLQLHEYWLWIIGLSSLAIIAALSLALNAYLLCRNCQSKNPSSRIRQLQSLNRRRVDASPLMDSLSSDFDSDNEYFQQKFGNATSSTKYSQVTGVSSGQNMELVPLVS